MYIDCGKLLEIHTRLLSQKSQKHTLKKGKVYCMKTWFLKICSLPLPQVKIRATVLLLLFFIQQVFTVYL